MLFRSYARLVRSISVDVLVSLPMDEFDMDPKKLWDHLVARFEKVNAITKLEAINEWTSIKMEFGKAKEYIDKYWTAVRKLKLTKCGIDADVVYLRFLAGLPNEFASIRQAIANSCTDMEVAKQAVLAEERTLLANEPTQPELRAFYSGHRRTECSSWREPKPDIEKEIGDLENRYRSYYTGQPEKPTCFLDSCASDHYFSDKWRFKDLTRMNDVVNCANQTTSRIAGRGDISITCRVSDKESQVELTDAKWIPGFSANLISVAQLCKQGYKVLFVGRKAYVTKGKETVMIGVERGGIYAVNFTKPQSEEEPVRKHIASAVTAKPWNVRLNYPGKTQTELLKRCHLHQNDMSKREVHLQGEMKQCPQRSNSRAKENFVSQAEGENEFVDDSPEPAAPKEMANNKSSSSKRLKASGSVDTIGDLSAQLKQVQKRLNQLEGEYLTELKKKARRMDRLGTKQAEKVREQDRVGLEKTVKEVEREREKGNQVPVPVRRSGEPKQNVPHLQHKPNQHKKLPQRFSTTMSNGWPKQSDGTANCKDYSDDQVNPNRSTGNLIDGLPTLTLWHAVKNPLEYVKAIEDVKPCRAMTDDRELRMCTDASLATMPDREPISGVMMLMCDSSVWKCWMSKMQSAQVALSTKEAEFYALSKGTSEELWATRLMAEFGVHIEKFNLLCDEPPVIAMFHDQPLSDAKRIKTRNCSVKDQMLRGRLDVTCVESMDQKADYLTAALKLPAAELTLSQIVGVKGECCE